MQRFVLILALVANLGTAAETSTSLEKRVTALETEVAALKEENRKLRESALEILATQLEERDRQNARLYYRKVVLPMMSGMLKDFGAKAPALPKEEEINTLADAYRPLLEMLAQLGAVAGGGEMPNPMPARTR